MAGPPFAIHPPLDARSALAIRFLEITVPISQGHSLLTTEDLRTAIIAIPEFERGFTTFDTLPELQQMFKRQKERLLLLPFTKEAKSCKNRPKKLLPKLQSHT